MEILSRGQLLSMDAEALRATAECHGLDVDGVADSQLVDEFDDFLECFRALQELA